MYNILGLLAFLLMLVDVWLVQAGTVAIIAKTDLFSQFYEWKLQWGVAVTAVSMNFLSPVVIDNRGAPFRTLFCVIFIIIQFISTVLGVIVLRSGHAALASFAAFNVYYGSDLPLMIVLVTGSLFLTASPMLCWWASIKSRERLMVSNIGSWAEKVSVVLLRGGPNSPGSPPRGI